MRTLQSPAGAVYPELPGFTTSGPEALPSLAIRASNLALTLVGRPKRLIKPVESLWEKRGPVVKLARLAS